MIKLTQIKPVPIHRGRQIKLVLFYLFIGLSAIYFLCHKWVLMIVNWARI